MRPVKKKTLPISILAPAACGCKIIASSRLVGEFDSGLGEGAANGVAARQDILALAIENDIRHLPGSEAFFRHRVALEHAGYSFVMVGLG